MMQKSIRDTLLSEQRICSTAVVMNQLHDALLADGYNERHCEGVALDVASALLAEGKSPYILYVNAKDDGFLYPAQFDGKVRWKTHAVAICDAQVYDPLLKHAVPESDYGLLEFGKEVVKKPEIQWTTESLRRLERNLGIVR